MLNVNDLVIVNEKYDYADGLIGKSGIVVSIDDAPWPVNVEIDGNIYYFESDELSKV